MLNCCFRIRLWPCFAVNKYETFVSNFFALLSQTNHSVQTPPLFRHFIHKPTGDVTSVSFISSSHPIVWPAMNSESVDVSQAWWLSMNWKQGWSGFSLLRSSFVCLSAAKKTVLIQQGEFLLCSRPFGSASPHRTGGFRSQLDNLDSCTLFSICVKYFHVGVLTVSPRLGRTLELHKVAFLSQRCDRGTERLSCSWLEHKEHSSAVTQRTKVTDSTPN